jgi:hypothetical protein
MPIRHESDLKILQINKLAVIIPQNQETTDL